MNMLLMRNHEGVNYMCNETNKKDRCTCIVEILKVILILQRKASCPDDPCLDSCDKGFLGSSPTSLKCNTRPVMLYTASGNGTPWKMLISKTGTTCKEVTPGQNLCSSVFRIEKLDGCCATFRVLSPILNTNQEPQYTATNTFFTMDLGCCCAIKCLPDTFIEGV